MTEEGAKKIMRELVDDLAKQYTRFDPFDVMIFGEEIFHVKDGKIRQIPVMSKEGQELLSKL